MFSFFIQELHSNQFQDIYNGRIKLLTNKSINTHIIEQADKTQIDAGGSGGSEHDRVGCNESLAIAAQRGGAQQWHPVEDHAEDRGEGHQY